MVVLLVQGFIFVRGFEIRGASYNLKLALANFGLAFTVVDAGPAAQSNGPLFSFSQLRNIALQRPIFVSLNVQAPKYALHKAAQVELADGTSFVVHQEVHEFDAHGLDVQTGGVGHDVEQGQNGLVIDQLSREAFRLEVGVLVAVD